jgi:predicted metal-dependent hydrolase
MDYEIKYSARKTISLCIKDGRLTVKAPLGTPKKRISEIVNSHQDWIVKNLKKEKAKNDKFANLTDADIAKLKKAAKEIFNDFIKHKWLMPKYFKEQTRLDEIKGVYVPSLTYPEYDEN